MLYLLKRKDDDIGYDEAVGFVVRAFSPKGAREQANKECGDEGEIWEDTKATSCRQIKSGSLQSGSKVILRDFNNG